MIEEGAEYKQIMIVMDTWPGLFRLKGIDGKTKPRLSVKKDGKQAGY